MIVDEYFVYVVVFRLIVVVFGLLVMIVFLFIFSVIFSGVFESMVSVGMVCVSLRALAVCEWVGIMVLEVDLFVVSVELACVFVLVVVCCSVYVVIFG